MLSEKMQTVLNKHINVEFHSAYLYLSMAAYLESANMRGMAAWMLTQSKEEVGHGMKLYRHIIDRGNRVQLAPIAAVKTTWKSPKAVFEEVLEHEKEVTGIIHNEVNQTNAEKDHTTSIMLQEFVSEQVEEEANVGRIVQTFKMIGDSAQGLIMLDRELGSRK